MVPVRVVVVGDGSSDITMLSCAGQIIAYPNIRTTHNISENQIVPSRLKNLAKARVYYGGQPVEVSDKERECLIRMLSTTD